MDLPAVGLLVHARAYDELRVDDLHTYGTEISFVIRLSSMNCLVGLDWIGLDWIGLDWIGLDWIDDWIGLD